MTGLAVQTELHARRRSLFSDGRGGDPTSPHSELAYQAGLDGLRAVSIIGVLLYHGAVSWAGGGFLGVESFFVLSGFLITSLLLVEWRRTGAIRLRNFWARRARRLLPALFIVVIAIGVYYAIGGPLKAVPGMKGDGIAALFYYSNWHQIANGSNYFFANGPVSPFQHTWSLAIEEQFYVFWPLVLTAIFWLTGARRDRSAQASRRSIAILLVLTVIAVIAAAVDTALLFGHGKGLDRVYYGTDTRAAGLLSGAALAIALALLRRREAPDELSLAVAQPPGEHDKTGNSSISAGLGIAAVAAVAAVLAEMHFANANSSWLFPFGLLGIDLAVVILILAVTLVPRSPVSLLLASPPMRGIGRISYGLYLWHFPLFLWLNASSSGTSGAGLLFLRLAVLFAVAIVSYVVVEQPIRRRRLPTIIVRPLLPIGVGAALAALLIAANIDSQLAGGNLAPVSAKTALKWRGTQGPCTVTVADTTDYRAAPLTPKQTGDFESKWLLKGFVDWSSSAPEFPDSAPLSFRTCPPKRVLLIGDSISFTLGLPIVQHENRYGVELANATKLGCAFSTRGELFSLKATWQSPPAQCTNALKQWAGVADRFRADAVIVELGYRDEFNWRWHGRTYHLGQRTFDRYVKAKIENYVKVLGKGGKRRVLFLTVPYVSPATLPDGSPPPSGSIARHRIINSIIESVMRNNRRNVGVLDIDKVISPGNRYNGMLNGTPCRFDGIHVTVYCASLLQPAVLGGARELLDR